MITASAAWIISGLLSVIGAISWFAINKIISSSEKRDDDMLIMISKIHERLSTQEEETDQVKYNYLNRFEKVNKNITDTKEELLKEFYEIRLSLAKKVA